MTREEYLDRVRGALMGKNIGGTLGMPMEWVRKKNDVTYYTHDITGSPLPNDDLDIQILWLLCLEDTGFPVDTRVLASYFNEFMIFTHAEYGTAKSNLRMGLLPPVSGTFGNDFKDSCGSYIRSEIWALLFPGDPEAAARCAFADAIIDHGDGEGVYAEVFMAALESAAFYVKNERDLLRIALSYIPRSSAVCRCVEDAIRTFDAGMNEDETREHIMQHWIGHLEWHAISIEDEQKGYAQGPMGWDVPSNLMIIVYGLLFGGGNYEKAMCTAVHYGEDTDCTAGTIAALYGILYGESIFERKWTDPIGRNIVTISIDPFRMMGRIPKTIDEMAERIDALREKALLARPSYEIKKMGEEKEPDAFMAKPYFQNIFSEMKTVRYVFPGLIVSLDYLGDPLIKPDSPKQIRFILSNTSRAVTSDRVGVYLYAKEGCRVLPQPEKKVFLTMPHMGSGIKELDYEIEIETPTRPVYRFVAEFLFEDAKNNVPMEVPFVLLCEEGKTRPVVFEKNGPPATPNLPRL